MELTPEQFKMLMELVDVLEHREICQDERIRPGEDRIRELWHNYKNLCQRMESM
jgi:hypothetical protein